jgi:hypothetical protein
MPISTEQLRMLLRAVKRIWTDFELEDLFVAFAKP